MSKRAELRRAAKKDHKAKTATYNLTEAQLEAMIREKLTDELALMKKEAAEEAVNEAMALSFIIPMQILMDHYWQKSYAKKLHGFADHLVEYYSKWQDGELDLDAMKERMWNLAGVRFGTGEEGETVGNDI